MFPEAIYIQFIEGTFDGEGYDACQYCYHHHQEHPGQALQVQGLGTAQEAAVITAPACTPPPLLPTVYQPCLLHLLNAEMTY